VCGRDEVCPRRVPDRITGPRVRGFRCRTEFLDDVSVTVVPTEAMCRHPSSSSSSPPASDDEDDDGAELVRFM
jgi:hypothetical protein